MERPVPEHCMPNAESDGRWARGLSVAVVARRDASTRTSAARLTAIAPCTHRQNPRNRAIAGRTVRPLQGLANTRCSDLSDPTG